MPKASAGLMMFREREGALEVLLVHPGGPFWKKRDEGAWSIPKGEVGEGEALLACAEREFKEETGHDAAGPFWELGSIRMKSGKVVHAWGCRGEIDAAACVSNAFEAEWPPRSGKRVRFPEADQHAWYALDEGRRKILPAQAALIDRLERGIRSGEIR